MVILALVLNTHRVTCSPQFAGNPRLSGTFGEEIGAINVSRRALISTASNRSGNALRYLTLSHTKVSGTIEVAPNCRT